MEEYKDFGRQVRSAAPLDLRLAERAEAFGKAHAGLVYAAEWAAVALGAAGLLRMLSGV